MSAVRFFDDIPHIVRYGMHSEEKEICWIWFWRCGVRFIIDVNGEDVKGTSFYEKWKPLLQEYDRKTGPLRDWVGKQWHPLCDLIMSASMETLKALAPEKQYWTTVNDYLHCPAYRLKLKAVPGKDSIEVEVTEGPKMTAAYQMAPVPFEDCQPMSDDLPRFQSDQLVVLDKDQDWRRPPEKVRAPDGKVYFLKDAEQSSMAMPEKKMTNASLDAIVAHLSIYELMLAGGAEPPEGVLTFQGLVTCNCVNTADPASATSIEDGKEGIAGILLPWISKGKTLFELCRDADEAGKSKLMDAKADWKMQVKTIVQALHERKLFLGGRPDWAYLNQHTVMIDARNQAWVTASLVSADNCEEEQAEQAYKMDRDAIEKVFEEWLPSQLY